MPEFHIQQLGHWKCNAYKTYIHTLIEQTYFKILYLLLGLILNFFLICIGCIMPKYRYMYMVMGFRYCNSDINVYVL